MSDDDRILRINAVLDRTGLTRATLYRKIADGSFPPQVRLNPRCVGWHESSVRRWVMNPYGYRVEDDDGLAANDNAARGGEVGHGEG